MEARTRTDSKKMRLFNGPMIFSIRFYKKVISPFLPRGCRFEPTCSIYALGCFERFGFFRASFFMIKRILRCHPFCEGGVDPVPPVMFKGIL